MDAAVWIIFLLSTCAIAFIFATIMQKLAAIHEVLKKMRDMNAEALGKIRKI